MIVMGAYGSRRLRERLFGGVTRWIVGKPPLPLFLVADGFRSSTDAVRSSTHWVTLPSRRKIVANVQASRSSNLQAPSPRHPGRL
ncbi:universal stress protein [Mesorhizobium sp. M0954]